jgi:holo-[acyl-carrier protein] synthase
LDCQLQLKNLKKLLINKMKIFGIGTDIVNIKRLEQIFKKNGKKFKEKIFSKNEINYCENKKNAAAFYAKRFAAKEALSKALGTGIRKGINFQNIEISNDNLGKPSIKLNGNAELFLKKKIKTKNYSIFLSLSDDLPWAQATVIISYK